VVSGPLQTSAWEPLIVGTIHPARVRATLLVEACIKARAAVRRARLGSGLMDCNLPGEEMHRVAQVDRVRR
jgi:hypothetical protein